MSQPTKHIFLRKSGGIAFFVKEEVLDTLGLKKLIPIISCGFPSIKF